MDARGRKPTRRKRDLTKVPAELGQTPANVGKIPVPPRRLTKREQEVARLISLGCTVAEAGIILYRSRNTVDNHKSAAMKKLDTHNLAEFTRRVIQLGISDLYDRLSPQEQERKQLAQQQAKARKKKARKKGKPPEKPR